MLFPLVGDAKNFMDYAFSSSFSFLYSHAFICISTFANKGDKTKCDKLSYSA